MDTEQLSPFKKLEEPTMNKITRLQQAMPASMQAIVLRDGANRFYLTGMKSSAGTVLATRNKAWLIIDFRYLEEAENKVKTARFWKKRTCMPR